MNSEAADILADAVRLARYALVCEAVIVRHASAKEMRLAIADYME